MIESKVLSPLEVSKLLASFTGNSDLLLIARSPLAEQLRYDLGPVKAYLRQYCASPDNDCPDGAFDDDCTHFVCHALNASGVFVKLPSASCKTALCIRVKELAASFHASADKYKNVRQLHSHAETATGDFCFIPAWFGLSVNHVMVLADKATPQGASVWSHTNNRCADKVDFKGEDCVYYRITNT